MSRTNSKYVRGYLDGYDFSGYIRSVGELGWMFDVSPDAALSDGVKNVVMGQGSVSVGAYNAFLDNDTAGLFSQIGAGGTERLLTIPIGTLAEPTAGDMFFAWKFKDVGYRGEQGDGFVVATLNFGEASSEGVLTYNKPWGTVLHGKSAETTVNSAMGIDDRGASTAAGGIFVYHLFSSDGTVTLKAQHASVNSDASFADLTGATSGSIDASISPKYGMVALSTSLTINRYLRWQISLDTATTATFFAGLIRI